MAAGPEANAAAELEPIANILTVAPSSSDAAAAENLMTVAPPHKMHMTLSYHNWTTLLNHYHYYYINVLLHQKTKPKRNPKTVSDAQSEETNKTGKARKQSKRKSTAESAHSGSCDDLTVAAGLKSEANAEITVAPPHKI